LAEPLGRGDSTTRPPVTDHIYEAASDFGVLYDAVPAYAARSDIPFYLREADQVAGGSTIAPILDLGCGTGRVLLALARAGHTVSGLDQSHAMLAQCRVKLAAEPAAVRSRVDLHHADVREFTLASPAEDGFALAIAPFRLLQHLTTTIEQVQCLEAIRRHLAPGGRFVFDVFNPRYPLLTQERSQEVEDTAELQLSDGRHLRRTARVTGVRWVDQVSEVELIYYVRAGTAVQRFVHAFSMRWYTPPELEHLLERTGFHIEAVYGDFERSALADESPEIIVVAVSGSSA
jgi:SAM-dependent methyltransferase